MRRFQRRGSARAASNRLRFAAISSGLSSGMARSARASPAIGSCGRQSATAGSKVEAALAFALGFVALLEMFRRLFVVARERLVSGIRDALFERLEIEHAEQRIAAADIRIEEAERLAGLDGLDPQRDLGEFDRHRVAIDAMDAGARHIAQRVAVVGRRGDAASPSASEPRRDPSAPPRAESGPSRKRDRAP